MESANIESKFRTLSLNSGKSTRLFWMTSLLILCVTFFTLGSKQAISAAGDVKWHPGHYLMLVNPGDSNPAYMADIYDELAVSAFRGVVIRYTWAELEPQKDIYDFSAIEQHLTELASRNKQLIVLIETKSFTLDKVIVPEYVKTTPIYEGGVFAIGEYGSKVPKGYNIKMWNSYVQGRMRALIRNMGQHFDIHPNFEGFGLTETAMGTPIEPLTASQIEAFYGNLMILNQRMRYRFPNTMTFQFVNYPRAILETYVDKLQAMGSALGAPDVFPDEPGLNYPGTLTSPRGIYTYYPERSGLMPLAIQIEKPNYLNTRVDGTGHQPTIGELLSFARDNLKVNYLFWTRTPEFYTKVLNVMKAPNQKSNIYGGLSGACPANYTSCIE